MLRKKRLSLLLICMLLIVGVSSVCSVAAAKKVKLTLWGGYPEMSPFSKKVIEDYQKENPNVEISFLTHPLREHEQKLSAAIPGLTP